MHAADSEKLPSNASKLKKRGFFSSFFFCEIYLNTIVVFIVFVQRGEIARIVVATIRQTAHPFLPHNVLWLRFGSANARMMLLPLDDTDKDECTTNTMLMMMSLMKDCDAFVVTAF